jgi:hypothetical protein
VENSNVALATAEAGMAEPVTVQDAPVQVTGSPGEKLEPEETAELNDSVLTGDGEGLRHDPRTPLKLLLFSALGVFIKSSTISTNFVEIGTRQVLTHSAAWNIPWAPTRTGDCLCFF